MLISVTRLRIRSPLYMPMFIIYSILSSRQARRAPGNSGIGVLRDAHNAFWTRTAWRDEKAMHSFMLAGMHRRAMPKLLDWCDEAATVHWTQESSQLPDWQEAHRRIVREGRRSKVKHPSSFHLAFKIPPPNIPYRKSLGQIVLTIGFQASESLNAIQAYSPPARDNPTKKLYCLVSIREPMRIIPMNAVQNWDA